jgi:DNA gyrase subunit A
MDVVFVTKNGMVKRTSVDEFRLQGRGGGGIAAMSVAEDDAIVGMAPLKDKAQSLMVVTKSGTAIRFSVEDVRQMGRGAQGTRAIRLQDGDEVVAVTAV